MGFNNEQPQAQPGVNVTNENPGPTTTYLQRENDSWTGEHWCQYQRQVLSPNDLISLEKGLAVSAFFSYPGSFYQYATSTRLIAGSEPGCLR